MDAKYLSGRIRRTQWYKQQTTAKQIHLNSSKHTLLSNKRHLFWLIQYYRTKAKNLIHFSPVFQNSSHTSLFTSSIIMSMAAQSSPLLPPLSTIFLSLKQYSLICLKRKSLCYKGYERCHLISFRTSYLVVSNTYLTLRTLFSKWKYLSEASLEIDSLKNNKIIECC